MKGEGSILMGRARCDPLTDHELHAFLSGCLANGRSSAVIESVERKVRKRRADWRGARLFERVTVRMAAGETLKLFLKYRGGHPDPDASMISMEREARVYRDLLQDAPLGAPKFFGAHTIEPGGPTLLLLEYLEGRKLKKVQEREAWLAVAKWLARMHRHFSERQDQLRTCAFLPRHDADFYWKWACRAAASSSGISPQVSSSMERLLSGYDKVAGPLGNAPATLLHGEFYCTNVIVSGDPQRLRVCAFDWETAAIGCGVLDLAYLFRQPWGVSEPSLIEAYLDGWREADVLPWSLPQLQAQILRVRTHELMCRIWSGIRYRQAPVRKIEKYTKRAGEYLESL